MFLSLYVSHNDISDLLTINGVCCANDSETSTLIIVVI